MFYPIPSLGGKYEIDEKGVVRNARTKRVKKLATGTSYHFWFNKADHWICHDALMAEVFDKPDDFLPIPSLDNKYEINQRGIVRNAKTKKKLTPYIQHKCKMVSLFFEEKAKSYSVNQLLWEVFGKVPKRTNKPPITVYLSKDGRNLYFSSIYKAAIFLSENLFLTADAMDKRLRKRQSEIHGWKIFYREPDERVIKPYKVFLARGDKGEI